MRKIAINVFQIFLLFSKFFKAHPLPVSTLVFLGLEGSLVGRFRVVQIGMNANFFDGTLGGFHVVAL